MDLALGSCQAIASLKLGNEFERNGIHTVARVFSGEPFALEDVSQVAAAIFTNNFNPKTVRIRTSLDRSFDFLIKAGPTAPGIKLIR